MLPHMQRTTLMLDDDLHRQLKRQAAAEGRTLRDLVNTLLRRALREVGRRRGKYRLDWPTVSGKLQPGVRLDDRDSLFDLMDGR